MATPRPGRWASAWARSSASPTSATCTPWRAAAHPWWRGSVLCRPGGTTPPLPPPPFGGGPPPQTPLAPEIGGAARPSWAGLIRPITGETECGDAYGAVQVGGAVIAVLC